MRIIRIFCRKGANNSVVYKNSFAYSPTISKICPPDGSIFNLSIGTTSTAEDRLIASTNVKCFQGKANSLPLTKEMNLLLESCLYQSLNVDFKTKEPNKTQIAARRYLKRKTCAVGLIELMCSDSYQSRKLSRLSHLT